MGHETAGVVEEVGEKAAAIGLKKGDRVCVNPVSPCFACVHCLNAEYNECDYLQNYGVNVNGAYAEYVKAAYSNVYKIPDEMSFEEGGLAEPLACGMHSVKRLDIQIGQTVVVVGTGPIGLMDVQLVRAAGAGKVIALDIEDNKLDMALSLGADYVFNTYNKSSKYYTNDIVKSVRDVNNGKLAHRALVPTGSSQAWQNALHVTGGSSIVVYFGLPSSEDMQLHVPALNSIYLERDIRFSWLSILAWDNVFNAIASGQVKLNSLITHRFSLESLEEGIKFMKESKEEKIKGIMVID